MRRRESIFGETLQGVPSPIVPHEHPYPTRYHGGEWTEIDTRPSYVPSIYQQGWIKRPYSVGASPDGIGELPSFTSSKLLDGVIGGGVGWIAAPDERYALFYAVGGALAGWGLGLLGIAGILGVSVAQMKGNRSWR
jgi:hypothetical protein